MNSHRVFFKVFTGAEIDVWVGGVDARTVAALSARLASTLSPASVVVIEPSRPVRSGSALALAIAQLAAVADDVLVIGAGRTAHLPWIRVGTDAAAAIRSLLESLPANGSLAVLSDAELGTTLDAISCGCRDRSASDRVTARGAGRMASPSSALSPRIS